MIVTTLLNILLITIFFTTANSRVEFTNIKCESLDKPFCDFETCFIKSVNRSYKYMSLKVNLFKVPITNATINWNLQKRLNGYKPFLYNVTVDACKFLKGGKNPVVNYFYDLFKNYSNMNHACPFEHDLFIEQLTANHLNNRLTKILPMPEGDYLIDTFWIAYNIVRAHVQVYLKID